jgi:tetratricopeptide (TPR) repeat protein
LCRCIDPRALCRLAPIAMLCLLQACSGAATRATPQAAGAANGQVEPVAASIPEALARTHSLAVTAMEAQDYITAEPLLEQLVIEAPEYPGPYVNLAILRAATGREQEAEPLLQVALAQAPAHAAAHNQLGILKRRQGRFAEAETAYRAALAADPTYALACHNLGVLLDLYLQRGEEALEYYTCYQELQATPDERVARWIVELERRVARSAQAAQLAPGAAP